VQDGNRDNECGIKPVGYVDVTDPALDDGAEENHRVGYPDDRDQQVDRPFELGVFFALGPAQGQRDGRSEDHQLPAPEHEGSEPAGE
jgi:hypothetical protein